MSLSPEQSRVFSAKLARVQHLEAAVRSAITGFDAQIAELVHALEDAATGDDGINIHDGGGYTAPAGSGRHFRTAARSYRDDLAAMLRAVRALGDSVRADRFAATLLPAPASPQPAEVSAPTGDSMGLPRWVPTDDAQARAFDPATQRGPHWVRGSEAWHFCEATPEQHLHLSYCANGAPRYPHPVQCKAQVLEHPEALPSARTPATVWHGKFMPALSPKCQECEDTAKLVAPVDLHPQPPTTVPASPEVESAPEPEPEPEMDWRLPHMVWGALQGSGSSAQWHFCMADAQQHQTYYYGRPVHVVRCGSRVMRHPRLCGDGSGLFQTQPSAYGWQEFMQEAPAGAKCYPCHDALRAHARRERHTQQHAPATPPEASFPLNEKHWVLMRNRDATGQQWHLCENKHAPNGMLRASTHEGGCGHSGGPVHERYVPDGGEPIVPVYLAQPYPVRWKGPGQNEWMAVSNYTNVCESCLRRYRTLQQFAKASGGV